MSGQAARINEPLDEGDQLFFRRCRFTRDHQRQRPFAPFFIRHTDHGNFTDRLMLDENVLDFKRRHPLAGNLDDILGSVGDLEIAGVVAVCDITGMQETTAPEVL